MDNKHLQNICLYTFSFFVVKMMAGYVTLSAALPPTHTPPHPCFSYIISPLMCLLLLLSPPSLPPSLSA